MSLPSRSSFPGRFGVWWTPVVLLVFPLFGRFPTHRDLTGYFLPIRCHTASHLANGHLPLLNWLSGCGEAWFANTQTGVLYPPAWLWVVLDSPWALTAEVVLHLCWLALGAGVLATSLGAGRAGRLVAEAGMLTAGPVLTTIGVLNNLETLAWMPWMVLAARRRDGWQVPLVATTTALGWLAAEPQLWAIGVVLAVAAARWRWRTALGVALGASVVAVQIVPFVGWILEGDRGPGASSAGLLTGSVPLGGWMGLVVPGLMPSSYVESVFLGAPLLALAVLGLRRLPAAGLAAVVLAGMASLPAVGGESLYLVLTGKLVRYPSRFAVAACVLVVVLAACGAASWGRGEGRRTALVMGGLSVAAALASPAPGGAAGAAVLGALLLGAALRRDLVWLRWLSVGAGFLVAAGVGFGLIGLGKQPPPGSSWAGTTTGRIYSPYPQGEKLARLSVDAELGALWPTGYVNLLHGRSLVRTYAPIADRDLAAHCEAADQRSEGRWWVDSAGARWVVLTTPSSVPGWVPQRQRLGLWLHENETAWPLVALLRDRPRPGRSAGVVPGIVGIRRGLNGLTVRSSTSAPVWLNVAVTPASSWLWTIDGRRAEPTPGPGVLQGLSLPPGRHVVRLRYHPRGLLGGVAVSALAVCVVACLFLFGGRGERGGHR